MQAIYRVGTLLLTRPVRFLKNTSYLSRRGFVNCLMVSFSMTVSYLLTDSFLKLFGFVFLTERFGFKNEDSIK